MYHSVFIELSLNHSESSKITPDSVPSPRLPIYTSEEDYSDLEKAIHKDSQDMFGYRFEWTTASAGNDGTYSQVIDLCNKLTVDEIFDIIPLLKQLAITKNQEEFMERLKEV